MSLKAGITSKGAVLLGKYLACDGHDAARPLRVVTHAHADHTIALNRSLQQCEAVLMTPATKDLLSVLKGELFLMRGNVKTLDYEEPFEYKDERITFFFADHILGSAQVLVEDADSTRILYTSDFRMPKTPVIECDILVMEATYGCPHCVRPFQKEIEDLIVDTVDKGLCEGPVYVFGYYGKLQEVMEILWNHGVKVPYIVPERVFQVCKVYEKYGRRVGRFWHSKSKYAKELIEKNEQFVGFYHMASKRRFTDIKSYKIMVSGWEFAEPCRQIGEKEYVIALSDHSDFEELIDYVRRCRPKLVITDNYRIGYAKVLAREIRRRLGIRAVAAPPRKPRKR
ncbi:hypothetical protein J7K27_05210 [Candidatus Bathyarchaeota archaeon]|nr:hypothetical protein [Candidatus Bathyarchaeota archaeon]